jgi:hypothetical protein
MMVVPAAIGQVSSGASSDSARKGEPKPSRGAAALKWGAVARFEGSFYGAWSYDSEDEAHGAAKANCEKKHGKGKCNFTVISGEECWSLARAVPDRGGWGQGTGITIEAANALAMKRCKDGASKCKKSFTFCADGSNMFNDR